MKPVSTVVGLFHDVWNRIINGNFNFPVIKLFNYLKMKTKCVHQKGFTLVELMITLVISGIIVAAIYSAYIVQQRTYTAQDAVAEMQQNIRAALMLMSRDIRMAGFDPTGNAGAGIIEARADLLILSADLRGDDDANPNASPPTPVDPPDGALDDPGEFIGYSLYATTNDPEPRIGRKSGRSYISGAWLLYPDPVLGIERLKSPHPVAENIQAIEFQYLDQDGKIVPMSGTPLAVASGDLDKIRAVQISILAQANRPDRNFTNTMVYCPAYFPVAVAGGGCSNSNGDAMSTHAQWGVQHDDNYRRRLLITTIQCRNMGL